jgi:predicted Zn-dependent peptidase
LERSVEGGIESLSKLKLDDVKRAYNDKFHQGNLVFGVSSSLPEAEIKKALVAIWSKLPDGLRKATKSISPRIPEKPTLIVVQKANTSTGNIILAQAGITAQDENRFTLAAANFGFGGEPLVSRLFKVIRGELGWTYQIGSTYNAMGGLSSQQGLFIISSTPTIEFSAKTILKAMTMWSDYLKNGLKAEELMLAKESLVNSYPFEFDSAEKRLSARLYSYLNNVPMLSPEEYAKKINAISLKDAHAALAKQHSPRSWIISIAADSKIVEKQLADEQKEVPEAERIKISKIVTPQQVIN